MQVSEKRREAKASVLRHAAAWLEDQASGEASSDIFVGEDGEVDEIKIAEAKSLAKRLFKQANKLDDI